jgi:hypothetical protein
LRGGRIIGTTIKAIVETTEAVRLRLPFGEERRGSICGRSFDQMLKVSLALKYEQPQIKRGNGWLRSLFLSV